MKILKTISKVFLLYMVWKLEAYQVCYIIGFEYWYHSLIALIIIESIIAYFLIQYRKKQDEIEWYDFDINVTPEFDGIFFDPINTQSPPEIIEYTNLETLNPNNNNEK